MHEQKQSSEQVWSDKKKSYKKIDLNKDRSFYIRLCFLLIISKSIITF